MSASAAERLDQLAFGPASFPGRVAAPSERSDVLVAIRGGRALPHADADARADRHQRRRRSTRPARAVPSGSRAFDGRRGFELQAQFQGALALDRGHGARRHHRLGPCRGARRPAGGAAVSSRGASAARSRRSSATIWSPEQRPPPRWSCRCCAPSPGPRRASRRTGRSSGKAKRIASTSAPRSSVAFSACATNRTASRSTSRWN